MFTFDRVIGETLQWQQNIGRGGGRSNRRPSDHLWFFLHLPTV
jgi:hypothetical protein